MITENYSINDMKGVLRLLRRGDIILYEVEDTSMSVANSLLMKLHGNFKKDNFAISHAGVASGDLSMCYHSFSDGRKPALLKKFFEPKSGSRYLVYRYKGLCYNPSPVVRDARENTVKTYLSVNKFLRDQTQLGKSPELDAIRKEISDKNKEMMKVPGDHRKLLQLMMDLDELNDRAKDILQESIAKNVSAQEHRLIEAYRQEERARALEEQDVILTRVRNRIGDMAQGYQNLSLTGHLRDKTGKLPEVERKEKLGKTSLVKSIYAPDELLMIDELYNDLSWAFLKGKDVVPAGFGVYESKWIWFAMMGNLYSTKDQWSEEARSTFICSVFAARSILAASQLFDKSTGVQVTEKPFHDRVAPVELGKLLKEDAYWDCVAEITATDKKYTLLLPALKYEFSPKFAADEIFGAFEKERIAKPAQTGLWDVKTWKTRSSALGKRDAAIGEIDRLLESYWRIKALADPDYGLQCRYLIDLLYNVVNYIQKNPKGPRTKAAGELGWQGIYELFAASAQAENVYSRNQYEREKLEQTVAKRQLEKSLLPPGLPKKT